MSLLYLNDYCNISYAKAPTEQQKLPHCHKWNCMQQEARESERYSMLKPILLFRASISVASFKKLGMGKRLLAPVTVID